MFYGAVAVQITQPMSEQQAANIPSAARLVRVETVLVSDPTLKAKLGKKSVEITKRGGDKVKFSPEVVAVATAMQEAGIDPCAPGVSKATITEHAERVFGTNTAPLAELAPEAAPAPAGDPALPTPPVVAAQKPRHHLGIYTLLLSAIQLAQADTLPGAERRKTQLEDVAEAFRATL